MFMKRLGRVCTWLVTTALLLSLVLTGCGSSEAPSMQSGAVESKSANQTKAMHDQVTDSASTANAPASPQAAASGKSAGTVNSANTATGSYGTMGQLVQDRKMIYRANLQVEVEKYKEARNQIEALVSRFHGYILASSDFENEVEKGGQLSVRIPQSGFSSFLAELDKYATRIPSRSIVGQDVTEEYVDLSSRLKARQVVEARLLQFMAEAKKTEDLLKISSELGRVQEEIEQIKGRMRYLDENISYSTVELSIVEKKVTANLTEVADQGTWHKAWMALNKSLLVILAFFNGLIVVIAAVFPVLLLFAIILVPLYLYWRRKKRKQPIQSHVSPDDNG